MANELSQCGELLPPLHYVTPDVHAHHKARVEQNGWEAEYARMKWQRAQAREAKLAARPPCPHCGAEVVRDSKRGTAKLPRYCSDKCARAANYARWWAKHKDERNAARRVQTAGAPIGGRK